ncbi:MAG: HNH endonuclease [Eubacterium sp.]|nr:HNH endonuclease [Eubacterium sp.]
MTNKIYEITDEQFVELIKSSTNISEVLFKLGYTVKGNSWGFSNVRRRMDDLNIPMSAFKGKSAMLQSSREKDLTAEMLFKENCKHNRNCLRRFIIKNGLLPYKCAICGAKEWNGKTLSLELDHINGINNDNRLENLRFLCPNCHSQTTTYGSRNQQRNESKYEITEDLRQLVESTYEKEKSVKRVSAVLGIRRSVVTQIVNESGQKHSNQQYVIRYDENHNELARYGSLSECARTLIESGEIKTKHVSTGRRSIQANANKNILWLNSYWTVLDGSGIINNPLLESSLIDSENNVDEAQAKAA